MYEFKPFFLQNSQVALLQFGGAHRFEKGEISVFFLIAAGIATSFTSMEQGAKIKFSVLKSRLQYNDVFGRGGNSSPKSDSVDTPLGKPLTANRASGVPCSV